MLLKTKIIVDNKIAYTRIPRSSGCSGCKYNSLDAGKNDCRFVMLKRGITLLTYCNNYIAKIRWKKGSNWDYVITEKR